MPDTGTILSAPILSSTFPKPVLHEIARDGLLNAIDDLLASGITLVRVEGKPDVGKTCLLRQFAERHRNACVSLFVRPDSWCIQDPPIFYADIATQMFWCLHGVEPGVDFCPDEGRIRTLSFELQRAARKQNKLLYFILDGIEEVAQTAGRFLASVLGVLPTEYSQFRFVCTGDANWLPTSLIQPLNRKSVLVTGFTLLETQHFLAGLPLESGQLEELYRNCGRGNPGYLASARRALESGISASELLERLPDNLHDSFAVEWSAAPINDNTCHTALAILSHDVYPHGINELSDIIGQESPTVRSLLASCTFLEVPPDDSSPVTFISDSFRRFGASQTEAATHQIWTMLANFYSCRSTTGNPDVLPTYLQRAGRETEIIATLGPGTFLQLAQGSDSLLPLHQQSELGFRTALNEKQYPEALRFQMQSAVANDISQFPFARAEVLARLALNDYSTALHLAQNASLKSHRLQLMAAIARNQKQAGLTPEVTLLQTIETLSQQIQPSELGDDLVEVISDLMYLRADLGLQLLSRLSRSSTDTKTVDIALLRIAAVVTANNDTGDPGMSAAVKDIQSRIKNQTTRDLAKAISIHVMDLAPSEVLRQVHSLPSASEQLFWLRQWCARCNNPATAGPVLDHAVHLAIRTTEYLATAKDYREFCTPLPLLEDAGLIATLITSLDIQKGSARTTGPIQDYVAWQLQIAEAEMRLNPIHSGQRLLEVYDEVSAIKELDVKTVCLGSIVGSLDKVDPNGAFAYTATVRAAAEDEFRTSFITLLNSTADHDSVPKRIIEATARSRPDLALEVIAKLNYQSRRDEMLLYMVSCILDGPSQSTRYDVLCDLLGRWSDLRMEEDALDDIMAAVARSEDEEFLAKQWHHIQVLLDRGLKAEDPHLQSRILSCGLKIFHEARRVDSQLRELMLQRLVTAWTRIGDPGTKLRTAYVLAKRLSEYERETALEYLRRADSERSYYSALGEPTYISSLRLVIRAYSGLLPQERQRETDLDRITSLIDHVPAPLMRVRLWTDLALRVFRYERDDIGRKLVQSKLKPTLDFLKDGCTHEWKEAVEFAAPALYRLSAVYAIEYLAGLPFESSDLAFENILRFLVTRMPPGEPVKWTETDGFHLGYDTCVEILKLAERIEADHVVYKYASVVADSAVWKRNRFAPSQEQRNALSHQILELSQKKFPNPRCIAHEGFAIIAEGQATRLLRERHANWQPLIQRARALDNVSDRAFVLMMLGEMLHAGHIQQRGQLYEEARVAIDQIPAAIDRVERLTLLADVLRDQDPSRAKGVLKIAAEALKGQQNDGREELCRSVVDSAYQIDPDFAASLTSLLDNDSGRRVAQRRIEYQKLRTKWRDDKSEADLHEHEDIDALEDVARDLLESLNGERVAARSIESCISLLKRLQGASLHRCFWTFSWTLQNLIQKRSYSEEARSLLREVFEAVLSASEIGRVLITRAAGQSVAAGRTPERNSSSVLIKAGERSKAIDYIGHWLTTVASDFVYICDPYFGAGELEALRLILETNPTLKVKVITSRRKQENDGANNLGSLEQAYERQWRHLCEQSPPECEIIAIGNASGDLPIHDRWWLSRAGGMRTGTSFNQLGRAKDSEVSVLSGEEFAERLQEIEAYIRRERREHMGQRLSYQAFWL